jgi:hypothetical protein
MDEVVDHYGEVFGKNHRLFLEEVPFSEGALEECKHTHILVAGSSMSIIDVRRMTKMRPRVFDSREDAWYDREPFARSERVDASWYLLRKDVACGSTMKTFDEQRVILAANERVPQASVLVYAVVLYFLARNEPLFENVYARSVDVDQDGRRVYVGHFESLGLRINDGFHENDRRSDIGISALRIPTET